MMKKSRNSLCNLRRYSTKNPRKKNWKKFEGTSRRNPSKNSWRNHRRNLFRNLKRNQTQRIVTGSLGIPQKILEAWKSNCTSVAINCNEIFMTEELNEKIDFQPKMNAAKNEWKNKNVSLHFRSSNFLHSAKGFLRSFRHKATTNSLKFDLRSFP